MHHTQQAAGVRVTDLSSDALFGNIPHKQTLGVWKAFASFSTVSVSPISCIYWVEDPRCPLAPAWLLQHAAVRGAAVLQCCSAAVLQPSLLSTLSPQQQQPVHNEGHLRQLSTASAVQPETGADVSNLNR